jgi:hypothetical protein
MDYTEQRLAELLAMLPPAPASWVWAAQELPLAHELVDELIERAETDAAFRQALLRDLEAALEGAGYESSDAVVAELRRRLAGQSSNGAS